MSVQSLRTEPGSTRLSATSRSIRVKPRPRSWVKVPIDGDYAEGFGQTLAAQPLSKVRPATPQVILHAPQHSLTLIKPAHRGNMQNQGRKVATLK